MNSLFCNPTWKPGSPEAVCSISLWATCYFWQKWCFFGPLSAPNFSEQLASKVETHSLNTIFQPPSADWKFDKMTRTSIFPISLILLLYFASTLPRKSLEIDLVRRIGTSAYLADLCSASHRSIYPFDVLISSIALGHYRLRQCAER